jgi:threonylcarbamoyladenosine tRNA methylthiotransferase MtaB
VREVVLTGIETGSYGKDFSEKYTLADLIAELDERRSCERIRLGSLAPELVGERFVSKVASAKILAPHFHISMQSGSSSVLRAMKRRYSREMLLENIARIKRAIPRATFTTDIMVGFPGESEEDFLESVSALREIGFLDAHVFAYSRRKNTPADLYPDQIPESVKRDRSERLIAAAKEVRESVVEAILSSGEALPVIFEERVGKMWRGHSDTFVTVEVECDGDMHGESRMVLPVSRKNDIIIGKII